MSHDTDRIVVPTNGRGPHPVPDQASSPSAGSASPGGPAIAPFTPTQVAVGFGILASLIVLLVGRLRQRSRSRRRGPFGRG